VTLFKKYCLDCNKLFRPNGRATKYCPKCYEKRMQIRTEKVREAKSLLKK